MVHAKPELVKTRQLCHTQEKESLLWCLSCIRCIRMIGFTVTEPVFGHSFSLSVGTSIGNVKVTTERFESMLVKRIVTDRSALTEEIKLRENNFNAFETFRDFRL